MRIRSLKNPKGLPSKNPENHGKSMIFQHLTLAPQARKKSSFCRFFPQSLCPGKAGFGGMLPDDEELPPVTDSEDEKPAYTTQCTNLERWQVLPTKPGGRCLGAAVFLLSTFLRFPQNRPTRGILVQKTS